MNQETSNVSRRDFIKSTTATATVGAAAVGVLGVPAPARAAGANERIRIGFIGPGHRGFGAHVKTLNRLRERGENIDLVGVSEVYSVQRDMVADFIHQNTGVKPKLYDNYEDMLADDSIDAVCIGTPDHWHAKQILDGLNAGKHVYCEKPMTHTVDEAMAVLDACKATGKVLQVGSQGTSLPIWDKARELVDEGMLGKVLCVYTDYSRNGRMGMSRTYKLTKEMTPKTVNWRRWLGVDHGLAPDMIFDRAVYKQWRCYWSFGSGMFTDLFVHRISAMLKATGLRFPARVVGGGGIFMEYDDREVTDVATVVADYNEGCELLVSSTMCSANVTIPWAIRGHLGSLVFPVSHTPNRVDFVPERPQVTLDSKLKPETFEVEQINMDDTHFKNFLDAIRANKPEMVNNSPEVGAAAVVTVNLAVRSYREGKAFFFKDGKVLEADASFTRQWEKMSKERAKPRHVSGWTAGDKGSLIESPDYMNLAGPWVDGKDPAQ